MSTVKSLKRLSYTFILIVILVLAACSSLQGGTGETPEIGRADLVARLAEKAEIEETGELLEQPFLSAKGSLLKVNGNDVQVFEYDTVELRSADSEPIARDESPVTMVITWIDQPNFWASGKLIVLYVGSDQATIDLLTGVLGEIINQ